MRTPQEAFESMCECHGEIWALTESGSVRTTKDEDGNKVREKVPMPLEVYDMLKVTGMRYAYRNWLMGSIEVLIPSSIKDQLEQEHSAAQLISEKMRAKAENEKIRQEIDQLKSRLKSTLAGVLKEPGDDLFDSVLRHQHKNDHSLN